MENLNNNSNEMKTIVETFIIEETAELIYDNEKLDKWNELVKELGLEGQTRIVEPEKSPIPFMFIKESMLNVFNTLCPRKVSVSEYDVTPIPVEILDLVALSKREKYFTEIQIWYDDKDPDPLCVGVVRLYGEWNNYIFKTKEEASKSLGKVINEYNYDDKNYLLGKWADVKHSFEELKEIATKRYISERGNTYKQNITDAQRGLDDLESEAFKRFN